MSNIKDWISKQSDVEEKTPSLLDSVLRRDLFSYVLYRLRFLSIRVAVEIFTTLIEFIFFFYLFKRTDIQLILTFKIITLVAEAWIWGALELPRARIRNLMNDSRRVRVRLEIRDWLFLSGIVSAGLFLISIGYLLYTGVGTSSSSFTYVELYVFASILKIAFDVVARTFHSCVYAVVRIYRPLSIIVILQMVLFASSLLAWKYFGLWALPAIQLIASILLPALTIYYTWKQYLRLKLPEEKLHTRPHIPWLHLKEYGFAFITSLTNVMLKFETLLVLIILRSGSHNTPLALFLFLISPVLKGSFEWARLFYFDYKKMEIGIFANLRDQFNRYLNNTALCLAVVCWGLAVIAGVFIFQLMSSFFIASMLLLFIFRSLLGSYQVRAFSNSKYIELLISEAVFASAVAVIFSYSRSMSISEVILLTASAEVVSLVPILIMEFKAIRIWQEHQVYSYAEWISLASRYNGKCRIGLIKLDLSDDSDQMVQSSTLLKKAMGTHGLVTCFDNKTILFLEKENRRPIDKTSILILYSGTAKNITFGEFEDTGKLALDKFKMVFSTRTYTNKDLQEYFKKFFPNDSYYIDMDNVGEDIAKNFAWYERQTIIREAMRYSRGMTRGSYKFKYCVNTFYPKGELKYIFLIPDSYPNRKIREWETILTAANYQNSLTV